MHQKLVPNPFFFLVNNPKLPWPKLSAQNKLYFSVIHDPKTKSLSLNKDLSNTSQ